MSPEFGEIKPEISLIKVVLPLPLIQTKAVFLFQEIFTEKSSNTLLFP
jgi:hypothetical protein